jgi:predicted dehydrogenase
MPRSIRVGVVGTSFWVDLLHLPALKSHPQAQLVAICGRNRARADEMAAKYGIHQVFTNYGDMFHHGGLDAAIVVTPDDLHYDVTLSAIGAGLHVLCDKPLASNAQQAREMYEKAESAGVKHMVLFTYRWMPFFRYVRDLIDQGYIGRFYHCEFRHLMGYAREREGYGWRFDQKRANGILGDLGVHAIDLARWLVGDITRVSAQLGIHVDRPGPDGGPLEPANDSALLLAEFANGAQGVIQASGMAHVADRVWEQRVCLYGEAGSLEIEVPYMGRDAGPVIRVARSQDQHFQMLSVPESYGAPVSPSDADPFAVLTQVFTRQQAGWRLFIDSILENRPASPSFYDGYKAQQVIDAALEANRTGHGIRIEDMA